MVLPLPFVLVLSLPISFVREQLDLFFVSKASLILVPLHFVDFIQM